MLIKCSLSKNIEEFSDKKKLDFKSRISKKLWWVWDPTGWQSIKRNCVVYQQEKIVVKYEQVVTQHQMVKQLVPQAVIAKWAKLEIPNKAEHDTQNMLAIGGMVIYKSYKFNV